MCDGKREQLSDLGAFVSEGPGGSVWPILVGVAISGVLIVLLGVWVWRSGQLVGGGTLIFVGASSTVSFFWLTFTEGGPGKTQVFEHGILYRQHSKVIACRWDQIAWVRVYTERQGFCLGLKGGRQAFGYNGILHHWPDILALIETVRSHVSALPSPPEWVEESGYQ